MFQPTAQNLMSKTDKKRSKTFNTHQHKNGSQWSTVTLCKSLSLKLDDQQLRISPCLRLGANISATHTNLRCEKVKRYYLQGIFCKQMCVALLASSKSELNHEGHVGISRLVFNARTPWTVTNWQQTLRPDGVTMIL